MVLIFRTVDGFALGTVMPVHDADQVMETLPAAIADPKFQQWQQRLERDPLDEDALINMGNRYLDLAAQTSDERYLGYLTQLLQGAQAHQSIPMLVLRARLLQRQHQFDAAEKLLAKALQANPRDVQTHLLMAYILMAQGDPRRAGIHCADIFSQVPTIGMHCMARAQALNGRAAEARGRLLRLQNIVADAQEQQEIQLTLAEIAERTGFDEEAEQRFRSVLHSNPQHILARLHLTDIYLRQQRYRDCRNLLPQENLPPSLLLRKAIAARKLSLADEDKLQQRLQRHFETEVLRNAGYASRDYALYLFELAQQNDAALRVAQDNWKTQREPEDAVMVLQAAFGAKSQATAAVSSWFKQTKLEDVRAEKYL